MIFKNSKRCAPFARRIQAAALFLGASASPIFAQQSDDIAFFAEHTFKTVEGHCGEIQRDGAVSKTPEGFAAEGITIRCVIPKMSTGNRNRDSNMWEILGYPGKQSVDVFVPSAKAPLGKSSQSFILRVNGHEKQITSEISAAEQGGSVLLSGEFSVSLSELDVRPPKLLMLKIGDTVLVRFRVSIPVK